MKNRKTEKLVGGMLAIFLALFGGQQAGLFDSTSADEPNSTNEIDQSKQFSDLEPVARTDLPDEAIDTLGRIDNNQPHPYQKDGTTFQNREGLLPDHDRGHYQEFTVRTPGESSRGARRIVAGQDGERYYTADHYRSFREILQ